MRIGGQGAKDGDDDNNEDFEMLPLGDVQKWKEDECKQKTKLFCSICSTFFCAFCLKRSIFLCAHAKAP